MGKYITGLCLGAGLVLMGADASGTVSATKGLQMNGHAVPVAGTKSWPVASGDVLKSDAAPVVLTMKDGSKIVLGKNSTARLDASTVRLVSGSMEYTLADRSGLQVAVKDSVLSARSGVASTVPGAVPPAAISASQVVKTEVLPPPSRRLP